MPFDKKKKSSLDLYRFTGKACQKTFKEDPQPVLTVSKKEIKKKVEGTHQNFCKSNITLNPKSGKDRTKTKDKNKILEENSPDKHKCKNFKKTSVNQIQANIFKNIIYHDQDGFISDMYVSYM